MSRQKSPLIEAWKNRRAIESTRDHAEKIEKWREEAIARHAARSAKEPG